MGALEPVVTVIFWGMLAADLAFATYDVVVAARGEMPSRALSITEVVVAAPQVALAVVAVTGSWSKNTAGDKALGLAYAVFTVGLTAHGLWGALAPHGNAAGPATGAAPSALGVGLGGSF